MFNSILDNLVNEIGKDRVERVKAEILARTNQLTEECIEPDKTTGWISNPKLKASHSRNQTCNLIVKGEYNKVIM